jgi:hypothetical protein
MSEEQIERAVESRTNALDRRLMRGAITQAEYDAEMRALSRWADQQLGILLRGSWRSQLVGV